MAPRIAAPLVDELEAKLGVTVHQVLPCVGGSINQSYQMVLVDGARLFVKTNTGMPTDFFRCESHGLDALRRNNSLPVAKVQLVLDQCLVLEWIETGAKTSRYNSALAAGLAGMHSTAATQFGFIENNYCGSTPQVNQPDTNGYRFFGEQRLLAQGQLAFDHGRLSAKEIAKLEVLVSGLEQRIPPQAPALLHGDLWSGNVISRAGDGSPVLIDPACYWGWPETDLAMMQLFGGFDTDVFHLYQEQRPLEPGLAERVPLYNLYHLLNHLNLFGSQSGYREQVLRVLNSA